MYFSMTQMIRRLGEEDFKKVPLPPALQLFHKGLQARGLVGITTEVFISHDEAPNTTGPFDIAIGRLGRIADHLTFTT